MWTTPAPPSTALVAASIWSGTGEVKTSPGQAASNMPGPTNPPCSGSCPEPPPDTNPTLPATGASLRTMIFASASWRTRSGWAAASPATDSSTTASGSLTSFFSVVVAIAMLVSLLDGRGDVARPLVGAVVGAGVGMGDGFLDRLLDDARRCEHVVDVCRKRRADEAGKDVDGNQLIPMRRPAADRRHQLRAEGPGRVERGARD